MNILIVAQVAFPTTIGGAGRYVRSLAEGMAARGHRVSVLALGDPQVSGPSSGIRVARCGPMRRALQVPSALRAARRGFRELHARHPFDLISIHQPLLALGLLATRRARRVPWVYHFHSPWAEETRVWRQVPAWDAVRQAGLGLRWLIEHLVVRRARRCVTLSASMRDVLMAAHGVPAERIAVIPGCADLARFRPAASRPDTRARLGLAPGQAVLLTVRNLVPRMNLDGLIDAMRLVSRQRPDAMLAIGGSGPLAASLQARARSAELGDTVRFLGRLDDDQLVQWYQAADVFVMPSKALEGFGLATVEALACGTPVVGTPVGGTRELLRGFDASCLAGGITPEAMAPAILKLLDRLREPGAQEAMAARCREFATRFGAGAMIDALDRLYGRLACVRVLHVHTMAVISGSGITTKLCMQGQRDAGFDVELACGGGGPLIESVRHGGFVAHPLRHMVQPLNPVRDALALLELWRLIRRHRYEVVHTHNSKAGFIGRLAATLAGTPVIVHTVHGFAFHAHERWWRRHLFLWLERLAARWCDHLVVISQPLIDWALRERIAPRRRMTKVYSGINLEVFRRPVDTAAVRAALGLDGRDFVIGEVAKLWPGKGHEVLFRAAATLKDRLPRLRLLIIGEGALEPALRRLARELGIAERVVFTGFRSDIPALMHAVDAAVLPSLFEGMGRAVLEAQAVGKPVIASRVGGIPDLIVDGQTGLLIEPGNVQALAAAILRVSTQPDVGRRLGQAAQRAFDERFEARTMVRQLVDLYQQLLCRSASA